VYAHALYKQQTVATDQTGWSICL